MLTTPSTNLHPNQASKPVPANSSAATEGKKEVVASEEHTRAGKFYTPAADIFETANALHLLIDMPGVRKDRIQIRLERDTLEVEGLVEPGTFAEGTAVYSEFNVGNFYRKFVISNKVDREGIEANMTDGVLALTLPKARELQPRRIEVK